MCFALKLLLLRIVSPMLLFPPMIVIVTNTPTNYGGFDD